MTESIINNKTMQYVNHTFCWEKLSMTPAKGNTTLVTSWRSSRVAVNMWIRGKQDSREEAFEERRLFKREVNRN